MESGIYVGSLRHRRFHPAKHQFSYPLFMAFLDVDRLPDLMKISPFSSYNRWNWASYCEDDHFGDTKLSIRSRVLQDATKNAVELPDGKIFLLTHLRYLGFNFNPVSFFYCYDSAGQLQAILAEVNNTFGETANYWLVRGHQPVSPNRSKHRFAKTFHVSPFMKMNQEYEWTFTSPSETLISECITHEDNRVVFDSTLKLERREWSRSELHRTLVQYPCMTLKVIAGIHWEAVRLFFKGVPIVRHPETRFERSNVQHRGASWGIE